MRETAIEAALRDPFVWAGMGAGVRVACDVRKRAITWTPGTTPLPTFVDVAQRLRDDRAAAAERVNRLLDMDPSGWRPAVAVDISYRTVAVVEGILASVQKTRHLTWRCFELTKLATEIADVIDDSWPALMRAQVASEAWAEHALALLSLGRYMDVEVAAHRAYEYTQAYPTLAIETALAQYIEGTAVLRQGRHDEALELALTSGTTFLEFGDKQRYVKARLLEGYALYDAKRFQESGELWSSLIADAQAIGDRSILAYLYNNIGNSLRNVGKLARARWYLGHALTLFVELGNPYAREVPRVRLSIARVMLQNGQLSQALAEMEETRSLFARLEMASGVAAAELDICEILIVMERIDEAHVICSRLPAAFRELGMQRNELEAAAFLKECADEKRLRVSQVQYVREYMRDLPQNPGRPFMRPQQEVEG